MWIIFSSTSSSLLISLISLMGSWVCELMDAPTTWSTWYTPVMRVDWAFISKSRELCPKRQVNQNSNKKNIESLAKGRCRIFLLRSGPSISATGKCSSRKHAKQNLWVKGFRSDCGKGTRIHKEARRLQEAIWATRGTSWELFIDNAYPPINLSYSQLKL